MYSEIKIETISGIEKHIVLDRGNGEFTSFSAQEDNPNYQQYLKWLEENN